MISVRAVFDSNKELLNAITLGESSFLELKNVRFSGERITGPSRENLADELAAFANSHGGVVVFGVDDKSREITGVSVGRLDLLVDFIKEVCRDSIEPPIENIVVDRKWMPTITGERVAIVKVEIPRSLFIHRSPGGYSYRVADSKREMSTEYLARMLQQRTQTRLIRFDGQPVDKARVNDLSASLWDRWHTERPDTDNTTFLHRLGVVATDDSGVVRPTVAGVLMACEDPRRWLTNAYIQAVAYRGSGIRTGRDTEPYQIDATDITGPLDRQIIDACRFVFKNMTTSAAKHVGRTDFPQYDMNAVFEAITNAVAHRDYSIHGSKIRLHMFDNRLELYSPGMISNSMTIGALRYRQSARNETLCSLLTKCTVSDVSWLTSSRRNIMEKRGEGVPIILDNSTRLSGKKPQYRLIDDSELLLTIFAADAKTCEPGGYRS